MEFLIRWIKFICDLNLIYQYVVHTIENSFVRTLNFIPCFVECYTVFCRFVFLLANNGLCKALEKSSWKNRKKRFSY